ncbi:uncharacterized protein LOC106055003 isoform X1 [Biomphalaria glabrata]|uniref:Uncharacterized protein LOC106055003 isoform X1 n=2 Tax=Biomphalaria glabrata TaxID=6526 RepID=A0A9U8DYL4_BIOGL|nr:uncharacterized protein LOC106055003 isoform X1 [Biomphalaria glabrata]XP_013066563.2 uncharacterized protein LOC106055003 isoform X1 [Biomphalaria glabrata]
MVKKGIKCLKTYMRKRSLKKTKNVKIVEEAPENTETSSESSGENTILNTPSASRIDSADVLIEAEDEEYHDEEQKNMVAQFAEGGSLESTRGPSFIVEETASSIDTKAGGTKKRKKGGKKTDGSKKGKKGKGKKGKGKKGKGRKGQKDGHSTSLRASMSSLMMSDASFFNLQYIAHDAPHALQIRGFDWPETKKKKGKGKKKAKN